MASRVMVPRGVASPTTARRYEAELYRPIDPLLAGWEATAKSLGLTRRDPQYWTWRAAWLGERVQSRRP
jgi:hypothetical protein